MRRKRTNYTEEFKKTIAELYKNGKAVKELQSEYGIADTKSVYRWIKKYSTIQVNAANKKEEITIKDYQELQKKNRQLEMENEILKKAVAIFTKP